MTISAASLTAPGTPLATAATAPPAAPAPRLGESIAYERFLSCVHCGLCTAACPTYLETGDENNSPRGRIYLMRAVTDGRLELTPAVAGHLDLCLDCRSCETACPSGVQYGRLIEPFRIEMQQRAVAEGKPTTSWWQRALLYGLFPYANRLRWSLWPARIMQQIGVDALLRKSGLLRLMPEFLQRMHRLLPTLRAPAGQLPEVLPARGPRRARVALFTGCVGGGMFDHVNWATARVLQANGCEVQIPRQQACCGAIHYHSGASDPALAFAEANLAAFDRPDVDAVIVNIAGCGAMLKDYGHIADELVPNNAAQREKLAGFAAKVRDVSQFLAELGPIPPTHPVKATVTYHDACHLVHAQKVREQPRKLLALVPELKVVPLAESEICCGAAGSYNLTQGDMADRLAERKIENIRATGADAVVMGNAGCSLQIQATLRDAGLPLPVWHPMEILDWAYGTPQPTL